MEVSGLEDCGTIVCVSIDAAANTGGGGKGGDRELERVSHLLETVRREAGVEEDDPAEQDLVDLDTGTVLRRDAFVNDVGPAHKIGERECGGGGACEIWRGKGRIRTCVRPTRIKLSVVSSLRYTLRRRCPACGRLR